MKDWLQIGQFSKITGLTNRALRMYEKLGLLESCTKGENGYRYYTRDQTDRAISIKKFKNLGFTLSEIKSLLEIDLLINPSKISLLMQNRLDQVKLLQQDLASQEEQLEKILISLKNKSKELKPLERRYIMSHFNNVSVVVTGVKDLELTAQLISKNLSPKGGAVKVLKWNKKMILPENKPYIIILPEDKLLESGVEAISPDIVVIKNISNYSLQSEELYLKLYSDVGPHMATVFNADNKASVKLAANIEIRKGRTFYFSERTELEDQIKKIGGVMIKGDEVKMFCFNLTKDIVSLTLDKSSKLSNNTSLLASLTAVLDVGLDKDTFSLPIVK